MEGPVLRLFHFRPEGPGSVLDAALRESVAPRLAELPGLRRLFLGRHGPGESGERLIASVWDGLAPMSDGLGSHNGAGALDIALVQAVVDPVVEVLPIEIALTFDGAGDAGILRVFRGETREGLLDAYVTDVRSGTIEDVEAGRGPCALYLAADRPVRFVTVSVWTGWDVIEAATGGNVRRPIATRHASRLVAGTAAHYEVIPEAASMPARPAPA